MKILLAEDEKQLSNALVAVLKHDGFEVDPVYDGEEAVNKTNLSVYDIYIFDIMMPKKDGITALKEIRAKGDITPALFLTAKSELDDRITGLDAGADDYLTKPFAMKELLARIHSITRRINSYNQTEIHFGSVTLNTEEQELKSQNSVRLAKKEAKLMEFFMLNPNKEINTDEILNHVWHDEENVDKGIVWVYVSYLKSKLHSIAANLEINGENGGSYTLSIK